MLSRQPALRLSATSNATSLSYIDLQSGPCVTTLLHDIDIVAQTTSSSGCKTATLRNVKNSGGETNRVVEVWNLGQLEVSLNVTEHHGDFYTDGTYHLRRPSGEK